MKYRKMRCALACLFCVLNSIIAEENCGEDDTIRFVVDQIEKWRNCKLQTEPTKTFITGAFAQSIDGKLASYEGTKLSSNLAISGNSSLGLTHACRSIHDAILIGIGTLRTDNPRLSNRFWGSKQPRPVVLDTDLSIRNLENLRVLDPIVCCSIEAQKKYGGDVSFDLLPCRLNPDGKLNLPDIVHKLRLKHGIRSIMVEGGPTLLESFFAESLFDCICITIAPIVIGHGKGVFWGIDSYALQQATWHVLGKDVCLIAVTKK